MLVASQFSQPNQVGFICNSSLPQQATLPFFAPGLLPYILKEDQPLNPDI